MANGSVSRLPSPGRGIGDGGMPPSAIPAGSSSQGDLLDKLHRHLTVVFSLRSFPKGNSVEGQRDRTLDGIHDDGLFFLPTCQDGKAYIKCYFEHATSTYRYLERQQTERLVEEFYGNQGDGMQKEDIVLLLLLMATGCLWTPSWTGVDPQITTKKSLLLLEAAQGRLAKLDLTRPKLRLVQIHIALCHLHLGMSEFRTAWLALGTAAQLGRLIRLHSKSPEGVTTEVDEPRRQAFWSSFMMDRYLSLVLGCPVIYDERDITQLLPSCPQGGALESQDEDRRLVGCIAHIKLSQILGHAWRQLKSPGSLSEAERSLAVHALNQELNVWIAHTPPFFHPDGSNDRDINPFASVPPFFCRQQQLVQSAFHFINLFIYRSYLLDQFNNRAAASPLAAMSPEVTVCVESAISIARLVSKMRDTPGAKRTFWNSAYFCFASLTVLLVYLMVYEEAPRRAEIENMIEAAMDGHIQLTGSTKKDRENVLEELKRLSHTLHRRQDRPQSSGHQEGAPVTFGNGLGASDCFSSRYVFRPGWPGKTMPDIPIL
ncbi:hypothetical protein I350_00144 [Cryptococcus amylolentus CBS 6273]|uniref:Xylanolytic transcriptional activator regulatory domain-containing protein n=1 Tax=Cryptococcus amylolentus CBS 6273 TaxID=1296118 RepID=A0A1E3KEC4_9TREE|nr:hypothetical protein I350_00144 [Cryptococcus amylolentus CBS 6273]